MNRSLSTYRRPVRRHVVYQTLALLLGTSLVAACGSDSPTAPVEKKQAEKPLTALFTEAGCDPGAAGASFSPTGSGSLYLLSSFGNAQRDAAFFSEVANQRQFWGATVPANVYIWNELSPSYANAKASPDGYILFGYYFYNSHLLWHGSLAIDGTLAHEWGHRVQQTYKWSTINPGFELEADAFSGYYMALRKGYAWAAIQGYYNHFASIGDLNFNTPDHHGTPNERLAAVYLGVNTAIYAMQNRQSYTYTTLHNYFSQEIAKVLAKNPNNRGSLQSSLSVETDPSGSPVPSLDLRDIVDGKSLGKEVEYPDIGAEERERLFPGNAGAKK